MRSRLVQVQLGLFLVIAIVGLMFVGAKYVRIDNLLGFGQYTVDARFKDAGGIFSDAEVTYRGKAVGRVGALSLTEDGINVELKIDKTAPDIPASSMAVVANRSAIGEQYVDLRPPNDEGPYLRDGDVIEDTATPVAVDKVLGSAYTLVTSVPLEELTTVVSSLGEAFNGQGDNVETLVDSLAKFTETADEALPETLTLIRDSRIVLDTQSEQSSAIRQFSSDLVRVADQLRASDPDVRRLIETGNEASPEVNALLDQAGPSLTTDLNNVAAVTRSLSPRSIALQPILQFLPALSAGAHTPANGDGTLKQGLVLETNNPPLCTEGYEGTYAILDEMKRQNPNFDPTYEDYPINMEANCTTPLGSVTGVRSTNRIIYADPDTPQPWDSKPKVDPDKLNLNPVATQIATLMGITPR